MSNPTVSATWLHDHLHDPSLVILDCRFSLSDAQAGRSQYQAGHIPGAHYMDLNQDLSSPVGRHGGRHPLPNPAELAEKLGAIGIHSGGDSSGNSPSKVVVYDDGMAFAARCWWLLRYLGHEAQVLDGGFKGWVAAGYGVTDAVPQPRAGVFLPRVQSHWVVDINEVKARKDLPDVALIDSREAERYRGEVEPIDPVAGHIPGAINYPWAENLENGYLRADVGRRWEGAPLRVTRRDRDQELMVYCGSGVTACVNLLALEAAGITGAKLYAGSWSDWCSYLD